MVDAIILAAGLSKRMGQDKMGLEISGQTVLSRAVTEALKSVVNKIIVVTRYSEDFDKSVEYRDYIPSRLVRVVNDNSEFGMSYSIKLGLARISAGTDAVMIILADQVCLDFSVINTLVSASLKNPGKIIAPTIKGRRTNPVIFPSKLFVELRQITGDRGGREIVALNSGMLKTVEFGQTYNDCDLDTMDDYFRLISTLESQLIKA
jgi:molybdenum cofactor cytidylyltransferase